LTLTLDRIEVTLVRICGRGLPTHQIRWKSEKTFCGRTDVQSTRSSVGDDLKIKDGLRPYFNNVNCNLKILKITTSPQQFKQLQAYSKQKALQNLNF